jgi:hypothetical protein
MTMENNPQEPPPRRQPQPPHGAPPQPGQLTGSEHTYSESGSARMEQTRETYVDQYGNVVQRDERVYDDSYERMRSNLRRIAGLVSFIFGIINALLFARFFLLLGGASASNDFVDLIYDLSYPFAAPFDGIFEDYVFDEDNIVEWASLIGVVVWSIIGAAIVRLIYLFFGPSRSTKEVYSSTRKNMP